MAGLTAINFCLVLDLPPKPRLRLHVTNSDKAYTTSDPGTLGLSRNPGASPSGPHLSFPNAPWVQLSPLKPGVLSDGARGEPGGLKDRGGGGPGNYQGQGGAVAAPEQL